MLAVFAAGALVAAAAGAVIFRQALAEGTDLRYRFERTVADAGGFDSGWHIHPGLVIVHVEEGSLQFYQGSCTPRTLTVGDVIVEMPWKEVRLVAPGRAAWRTTIFVPNGQELSIPLTRYTPQRPNPCP
jgi:quercetin dioxygenase-like cupin family protein